MTTIGTSDLDVFPLNLGGNVFGWTADERESFAVLDAYAAAGGNFVDTADVYSQWVEGNSGGESETILGNWLASRGNRDRMVIATKVGGLTGGNTRSAIREGIEGSLRRLRTDYVDLYYIHRDQPETPVSETLHTLDELVKEGKVRHIAASNFSPERLTESLEFSAREGLAQYVALQPHYNLIERDTYENTLAPVVAKHQLSTLPYYALAAGFLTGKYRPNANVESHRAARARSYLDDPRGPRVLSALDSVAAAHRTQPAAVALAWLRSRPTVAAPVASARTVEQLSLLLESLGLALDRDELALLDAAST